MQTLQKSTSGVLHFGSSPGSTCDGGFLQNLQSPLLEVMHVDPGPYEPCRRQTLPGLCRLLINSRCPLVELTITGVQMHTLMRTSSSSSNSYPSSEHSSSCFRSGPMWAKRHSKPFVLVRILFLHFRCSRSRFGCRGSK